MVLRRMGGMTGDGSGVMLDAVMGMTTWIASLASFIELVILRAQDVLKFAMCVQIGMQG